MLVNSTQRCAYYTQIVCIVDMMRRFRHTKSMTEEGIYKPLGEAVARRRRTLGLTQAELASRVGLSRASIANIEVGRQKMLVHQLFAVADALELDSVEHLLPLRRKTVLKADFGTIEVPGVPHGESSVTPRQRAEIQSLVETARPRPSRNKGKTK